jgi:DNA-directed RNA polymerase beta' subunit
MITANTPESIDRFRLVALKSALKLETLGMKRRGQSAYSIVKQELGLKGNKESVLKQLEAKIKEIKNDG